MNAPDLAIPHPTPHAAPIWPEGGLDQLDVIAAARSSGCVLFTGAPNAKGLALRIHNLSGWRWGPFLSVDCGASEMALEVQLFGLLQTDAAWTGGHEPRVELVQDGTLFLYEVGKLSHAMQIRLADALTPQPGAGRGSRLRRRIMASTSAPLLDRVEAGTFDDRLFYRLNAIHFVAPRVAAM